MFRNIPNQPTQPLPHISTSTVNTTGIISNSSGTSQNPIEVDTQGTFSNPIEEVEPPNTTSIPIEIIPPSTLNISPVSLSSTTNIFNEMQTYLPTTCLQTCTIVSSTRIYHDIYCTNFVCPEYMTEGGTHASGYTGQNGDGENFICRPMYCIHNL